MADESSGSIWWTKHGKTSLMLVGLFALALFIRTYFNFDASVNDGAFRWSGTDGYYHSRVIDFIVSTGTFLLHDPLINYPIGAVNPRPPVFVFTIAAVGGLLAKFGLQGGDPHAAAQMVAAWAPAFWGALTVFPLYVLGKEAFGRRAGMWAAIFLAVTAAHVTRSNFGGLDHDSAILFFLVLAAAFFTRSLQLQKRDTYVERYPNEFMAGWQRFFAENQAAVAYAALTGAAFGAIALVWKGYPYAFAIFAVWFGFQLLANHLRGLDSTGHFLLAVIPFVVALLMMWPYYAAVGRVESAVYPTLYILIGVLAASAVFVPTRHLPPVLVIPSAIGGVVVGLLVMIVALPHVGDLFFTGLGYFVQTKLYSTIAEAQRTQLGYLVFSVGIIPFFFALAGIVFGITSFVKKRRDDHLFVTVWAAIGLLMAFTATRFVFNATTAFALLAGWSMDRFIGMIDFTTIKRTWQNVRASGTGVAGTMRQSVRAKHWFAGFAIALLVLLPNAWFAVDAGIPGEYWGNTLDEDTSEETEEFVRNYFGAFGQDFLSGSWARTMNYLADQDTELDPEDRPAFIAWWDYGFYAAHLGKHPAVADPFQFGYEISGRFIASQSEAEAITWAAIRTLEEDVRASPGFSTEVRSMLDGYDAGLAARIAGSLRMKDYDPVFDAVSIALTDGSGDLQNEQAVAFYRDARETTGNSIRYFALEGRMFPCDDTRTQQFVDSGSIFYAPVFLADKNPDDFVQTQYLSGQTTYDLKIYETDAEGKSTQLDTPHVVDTLGQRFIFDGRSLIPINAKGNIDYDSRYGTEGIPINGQRLVYKDQFYNSLLYRAWVGAMPDDPTQNLPSGDAYAPGLDLQHFRLVHTTTVAPSPQNYICDGYARGVSVYKYYDGATVTGVVRDASGDPVAGAEVEVLDNFGIRHDTAVTGADGRYELLAPFSTDVAESSPLASEGAREGVFRGTGMNQLLVRIGGLAVDRQDLSVTDEQAMGGAVPGSFDFTIEDGQLSGRAFQDNDGNGVYDPATDVGIAGATVELDDGTTATADSDGNFDFGDVTPGGYEITVRADGYVPAVQTTEVQPGQSISVEIAVQPENVGVFGLLAHEGRGIEGAQVSFENVDTGAVIFSDPAGPDGYYKGSLPAGTYNVTVSYDTSENGEAVTYSTASPSRLIVEWGDATHEVNLQLTRDPPQ